MFKNCCILINKTDIISAFHEFYSAANKTASKKLLLSK